MPTQPRSVAVLVDTATGWGRRLVRGVTNYAHNHGHWHLWVEPHGQDEHLMLPQGWRGDGAIARVSTPEMAEELLAKNIPVVNISGIEFPQSEALPRVASNYVAVGRLAAEHFLGAGYRHFAYCGPIQLAHVRRHAGEFRQASGAAEADFPMFDVQKSRGRAGWSDRHRQLGQWLKSLPKPVGILCWVPVDGMEVLMACRDFDISTPDDVAVLSADDDPLLCDTTTPTLSAILIASEQIGANAAAQLDRLMNGQSCSSHMSLVDPITLTTRGSTSALAIEDAELRQGVAYLRQHAYRPLTIDAIADSVPMSRRSFERKFHAFTGHTPLEEIHRLRLARVRELLATTDRSISEIAALAGYGTPEYMTAFFREQEHITPLRYRKKVRGLLNAEQILEIERNAAASSPVSSHPM